MKKDCLTPFVPGDLVMMRKGSSVVDLYGSIKSIGIIIQVSGKEFPLEHKRLNFCWIIWNTCEIQRIPQDWLAFVG